MSGASPFAHRDFRLLLLGQTTSQLGAQLSGVAVPLLAVFSLHASPLQLGIVNASGTAAFALIGLPAGVWVDRWRRRGILIASDIARALLMGSIPLAWAFGVLSIGALIVVSLLAGVARVFFDVGYQSYIPAVIGKDRVLAGNSAMETIRATGQVVGPGIGGWLVALISAANAISIQAATFAVSAACLYAIATREPAVRRNRERSHLRAEIAEGLRFVAGNPILRATAITSTACNFAFAVASSVVMIFMARVLDLSSTVIGNVIAAGALAALAGAGLTPRLARWLGSVRVVWLPLAVSGPVVLAGAFAQPGWLISLLILATAAGELGQIVYAITNVSLRQRLCPEHLLGRVNATMRFLIMGLFPLGALIGGALGEHIGIRETLFISGALIVASPIPLYRALRHIREIEQIPEWQVPQPIR